MKHGIADSLACPEILRERGHRFDSGILHQWGYEGNLFLKHGITDSLACPEILRERGHRFDSGILHINLGLQQ
ncbi:MAG: hypothetical protein JST95_07440 [Bacteroidetes bacterium]|nr:hypothetical protein [Bacteroidota bacterium]